MRHQVGAHPVPAALRPAARARGGVHQGIRRQDGRVAQAHHSQPQGPGTRFFISMINHTYHIFKLQVWTMVAGGGASVAYADTITDMGYGHELANYGGTQYFTRWSSTMSSRCSWLCRILWCSQ